MDCTVVHHIDKATGVIVREEHRVDGKLHRDPRDGAAVIYRDRTSGKVVGEKFYWNGRQHREDGPAEYQYSESGRATWLAYFRHGRLHRDYREGPALVIRDGVTGRVREEMYYESGSYHRHPHDGPAFIVYEDNGTIHNEHYYRGQYIYPEDATRPVRQALRTAADKRTPKPRP